MPGLAPERLRPNEFIVDDTSCVVSTLEVICSRAARTFTAPAAMADRVGWFIEPLDPRHAWCSGLVLVNSHRRTATGWVVRENLCTPGQTVLTPGLITLGIYPQLRGWRWTLVDKGEVSALCTNSLKDIHFVKNFNKTCPLTTSKEEHDQSKC